MCKNSMLSKKLIRFEKFIDDLCKQIIGSEQFEINSIDDCVKFADKVLPTVKKMKTYKLIGFCSASDSEVKKLIVYSLSNYYVMQDFYYNHLPF